jgi:hypothetical protein
MKTYLILLLCLSLMFTSLTAIAQRASFKNYKVNLYKGHRAKLIIKGNPLAEMYRTPIREAYYSKALINIRNAPTGLNFAGHYYFLWWGCGSNCQHAAVVDLKTGRVYDGPTAANLFKFKRWSKLVMVNRPEYNGTCAFCTTEYWIWNENKKQFIQIQ